MSNPHRKPDVDFNSGIIPASRPHTDAHGNVLFQHNRPLRSGEKVIWGDCDGEIVGLYRDPLKLREFVTLLVVIDGQEVRREGIPVAMVRRPDASKG
jgi:hypothetical protein